MPMRILVHFPTRQRRDTFKKVFASWIRNIDPAGAKVHFRLTLDRDDLPMTTPAVLEVLQRLPNTTVCVGDGGRSKRDAMEADVVDADGKFDAAVIADLGGEPDLLIIAHDDVRVPPGWNKQIADDFSERWPDGRGALFYPDGLRTDDLCTQVVIGVPLYRELGNFFYWRDYKTAWADNEYTDVLRAAGLLHRMSAVMLKHDWAINDLPDGRRDQLKTRNEDRSLYAADEATYRRRAAAGFPGYPKSLTAPRNGETRTAGPSPAALSDAVARPGDFASEFSGLATTAAKPPDAPDCQVLYTPSNSIVLISVLVQKTPGEETLFSSSGRSISKEENLRLLLDALLKQAPAFNCEIATGSSRRQMAEQTRGSYICILTDCWEIGVAPGHEFLKQLTGWCQGYPDIVGYLCELPAGAGGRPEVREYNTIFREPSRRQTGMGAVGGRFPSFMCPTKRMIVMQLADPVKAEDGSVTRAGIFDSDDEEHWSKLLMEWRPKHKNGPELYLAAYCSSSIAMRLK
jgi:hypothetical protein